MILQGGVAHELITAEDWPFNPDLPHVDVTGQDVQLGDHWDGERFTRPALTKAATTAVAIKGVAIYHLTPSQPLAPHAHDRSHLLVVATGTVRVTVGERTWEMTAPSVCDLPANEQHGVESLTEQATILSIFEQDL